MDKDREENIGEFVLETLLSSNIESITDLNLRDNRSWFNEESLSNVSLLAELISKQTGLQNISIGAN